LRPSEYFVAKINLESLPEVPSSTRVGSCIARPGKFLAIGLNYSDHAAETNAEIPKEPILFNKSSNCIVGPNDNVILPKLSKKLDRVKDYYSVRPMPAAGN
jgi:2-keto-4-pentenoate hydratase/2-oxohepta-3-ene-1,7-dioic acid hydratase in catechol pathway